MPLRMVSLASQLEQNILTISGQAIDADPRTGLPVSHAEEIPQAAPGIPDLNQVMMAWGTRAQQYNDMRAIAGTLFEQIGAMRQAVQDAQNHCLVQSNRLQESQDRLSEAQELLTATNRTSLVKDEILKQLDHSAFSIAASRIIFEHAAQDIIPPSTVIRFSNGREEVFQDGNRHHERMVAGVEGVKTVLDAAATDVLSLGAPLTDKRRPPFSFPAEVLDVAKGLPGGLTIENIRTSYEQHVASGQSGSHTERITLDVPHNEDDFVADIPRIQPQVHQPAGEEKASTTPSAPPAEQKKKKSTRATRKIKTEDDAATRSLENAQQLHRKRSRPNTTIITQGSVKHINTTKKMATVHLWNDYGHVVPSQADTNMTQHQGQSAFRCKTPHGSGWDVYGSRGQDNAAVWCPECNKRMTETVPFWLPPGRFVYQLRLGWGLDEMGNVLNADGIAIDLGHNNVTAYADEAQGATDGWTRGTRWFKIPVQQDLKKPADLSRSVKKAVDSMPVFNPGTRKAKGFSVFKGNKDSWAELADFHTKRFEAKAPSFVEKFGGPSLVNIALQGLLQEVMAKLTERNSKAFDVTKDWFVEQDLQQWSNEKQNLDAFLKDIGLVVPRAKKFKKKDAPTVKQEVQEEVASTKRKRSASRDSDGSDDNQGEDEAQRGKRQNSSLAPSADITAGSKFGWDMDF
jgi:hypothetical protein